MSPGRPLQPLLLLLSSACSASLLPPGEQVLADPPLHIYQGAPGSALGAALAISNEQVLVGAPAVGEVVLLDAHARPLWTAAGDPGLGVRVWLTAEGEAYALLRGVGVLDLGHDGSAPVTFLNDTVAVDADRCPDGAWVTAAQGVIACGPSGQVLRRTCTEAEAGCTVTLDGAVLDAGVGPDGAVAFWGDVPCWGDVDLAADPLPGAVRCADGAAVQGEDGDHLGIVLGDGVAGGVFNKWQVPMRARAVALADGGAGGWSADRAAERTPLVVVRGEVLMAAGVPGYLTDQPEAGRVYVGTRDVW